MYAVASQRTGQGPYARPSATTSPSATARAMLATDTTSVIARRIDRPVIASDRIVEQRRVGTPDPEMIVDVVLPAVVGLHLGPGALEDPRRQRARERADATPLHGVERPRRRGVPATHREL